MKIDTQSLLGFVGFMDSGRFVGDGRLQQDDERSSYSPDRFHDAPLLVYKRRISS